MLSLDSDTVRMFVPLDQKNYAARILTKKDCELPDVRIHVVRYGQKTYIAVFTDGSEEERFLNPDAVITIQYEQTYKWSLFDTDWPKKFYVNWGVYSGFKFDGFYMGILARNSGDVEIVLQKDEDNVSWEDDFFDLTPSEIAAFKQVGCYSL